MKTLQRRGVLLRNTTFDFENEGVINPAVIAEGDTVHLFYRAVREGNYSSIGYCRLKGPLEVVQRNTTPLLYPEFEYESKGVEDPRIVKIEDTYYLTYTAYDGINAAGALAVSSDIVHFTKRGIITPRFTYLQFKKLLAPQKVLDRKYFRSYNKRESKTDTGKTVYLTDKNLVFFPRKIDGKFCFMHRVKPDIQLTMVDKIEDLNEKFWRNYFSDFSQHILMEPRHSHESSYIGTGCPPIETKEGWLLIYHSVQDTPQGYIYSASAALLDLDHPVIEIARLPYPLFAPEVDYELSGVVNQVCFPTGTALFEDTLYIYYGAADKCIACVSVSLNELINELITYKQ